MKSIKQYLFLIIIASAIIPDITHSALLLRAHGGTGGTFSMQQEPHADLTWHGGMRLLLSANENQRYGIECSFLQGQALFGSSEKDFIVTGFVLEQKLFNWFVMSIGTVGYLSLQGEAPFGIVTNLGWEPKLKGKWSPFITYRAEFIFLRENFLQVSSLSMGISVFF